jgi:hypothetical protein
MRHLAHNVPYAWPRFIALFPGIGVDDRVNALTGHSGQKQMVIDATGTLAACADDRRRNERRSGVKPPASLAR